MNGKMKFAKIPTMIITVDQVLNDSGVSLFYNCQGITNEIDQ